MTQARTLHLLGLLLTGSSILLAYAPPFQTTRFIPVLMLGISFALIGWHIETFEQPIPFFEWIVKGRTQKSINNCTPHEVLSYLQWLYLRRTQKTPFQLLFPQLKKHTDEELTSQIQACLTEFQSRDMPLPNRERYEKILE